MSIDLYPDRRPDPVLEQRLRAACQAVVPRLTDDHQAPPEDRSAEELWATVIPRAPARSGVSTGRRLLSAVASVAVVAGAAAAWAVSSDHQPERVNVSSPMAAAGSPAADPSSPATAVEGATTVTTVPCFGEVCGPVEPLPLVSGAADFYAAAESFGTPVVHTDLFEQVGLTRCVELTADGRTCQRIEGIAGVGPVSYPNKVAAVSTVPGSESQLAEPGTLDVEIGTTYADLAPAAYAAQWGSEDSLASVVVRGHDGSAFASGGRRYVVWQEQPGVLVWVAVPDPMADQLLAVAEGVRRLTGPASIPGVVVVTSLAGPFDARDNNARGVVYARVAGTVCAGWGWLPADCAPVTAQLNSSTGTIRVVGTAPVDAAKVRIDITGGRSSTVDSVAFAGAPEVRFFTAETPGAPGQHTVTWLGADGTQLGTAEFTVASPDAEPVATTVPDAGAIGP